MAKYSYEFKHKIVMEYLSGQGGYEYLGKKYGRLNKDAWRDDSRQRFKEAFRVLRPHGVLIF